MAPYMFQCASIVLQLLHKTESSPFSVYETNTNNNKIEWKYMQAEQVISCNARKCNQNGE